MSKQIGNKYKPNDGGHASIVHVAQPATHNPQPATRSRRSFLKNLWLGLGAIVSLEFLWMTFSFLSPTKKTEAEHISQLRTVGDLSNIPKDSVTPVRSGQFYLVRLEDGGLLALSLKCSHLGCSVSWDRSKNRFICPCHASEFAMNGNVINPPAPRALDYFPVIIDKGVVKVDTSKPMKRKEFEKSQETYW
jgi:cytochrome b6-f complex iron-sulfur subunit